MDRQDNVDSKGIGVRQGDWVGELKRGQTHDTSHEALQVAAPSGGKIIGAAGKKASQITTGRYINETAKKSFQGNQSYSDFYSTRARLDEESTSDSAYESVQGARIGLNTAKNTKVGLKNTQLGIKKTLNTGKQVRTSLSKNTGSLGKASQRTARRKSMLSRGKAAAEAVAKTAKRIVGSVKALFNVAAIKAVAIVVIVLLIVSIFASAASSLYGITSSMFYFLFKDGNDAGAATSNYMSLMIEKAQEQNDYYANPANFGVEYSFVTGEFNPDIYLDVLAVMMVQKQKSYSAANMLDFTDFSAAKVNEMFLRFYSVTEEYFNYIHNPGCRVYYCRSSTCGGHPYCPGHAAVRVTIVSKTADTVMEELSFTAAEKKRYQVILESINKLGLAGMSDSGTAVNLSGIAVDPDAYPQGDVSRLMGDVDFDPVFQGRLAALSEHYGKKVYVVSGYRTIREQQDLWDDAPPEKRGTWVAYPGKSRHNYGIAADVGDLWLKALSNSELAPYGLYKPMSYEQWHIEPVETKGR